MFNNKHLDFSPFVLDPFQQKRLKDEADKLAKFNKQTLLDTSNANETTLELVSKLDQPVKEITTKNLYKKYTEIPREINWQDSPSLVLPAKTDYNVDDFTYTAPKISSQKYPVKSLEDTNLMFGIFKQNQK